jgi:hypothetical protein
VRRRGLVILGVSVMLAAFILTTGFLRARKTARSTAAQNKLATIAASVGPTPSAPASAAEPTPSDVRPTADVAAPGARVPVPVPAPVPNRGKKSPAAPVAAAPVQPPTSPSVAPAKTNGVAGGLQIKTNYP